MIADKHRESEVLANKAAVALQSGRTGDAQRLYAEAAQLEEEAFSQLASDKERTRSILAVSFVSLLYKAQELDQAERAVFRLLGEQNNLLPWAEEQLRDLLQVVTDERVITQELDQRYTGDIVTVALRGGEIGTGTGPLDLVIAKATGFKSLFYRMAEWVGDYPLRRRGNPPKELLNILQVRASQPVAGSYRMDIRLTEPAQQDLFPDKKFQPDDVFDALFSFLSRLSSGTRAEIEEYVPDEQYRRALLELTRNVSPAGKRVGEIGLYRRKGESIEKIYLTAGLSQKAKESLPKRKKEETLPDMELRGVLRALHLDQNWLELTVEDKQIKCDTVPEMLDDVVGPMVNHEVVVHGPKRPRPGGVRRVLVEEIDLADPD